MPTVLPESSRGAKRVHSRLSCARIVCGAPFANMRIAASTNSPIGVACRPLTVVTVTPPSMKPLFSRRSAPALVSWIHFRFGATSLNFRSPPTSRFAAA